MQDNSISVIIPTFNRGYCICRAIDSVFAQTLQPTEIIVIDDGSTDNTTQQLAKYGKAITVIQQTQHGVSAARNLGLSHASGAWLALLDSDDTWQPNKLAQQMQALQENPSLRVAHTNELWIRNGKRVNPMDKHTKVGGEVFIANLALCLISPSSVVIHRDIFTAAGVFDETLPACEDYDLWLRITAFHPVLYIDEPLITKYGGHADQLSKKYWGMDRFRIQALEKILMLPTLKEAYRRAAQRMLTEKITIYANGAAKRGRTAEAEAYRAKLTRV